MGFECSCSLKCPERQKVWLVCLSIIEYLWRFECRQNRPKPNVLMVDAADFVSPNLISFLWVTLLMSFCVYLMFFLAVPYKMLRPMRRFLFVRDLWRYWCLKLLLFSVGEKYYVILLRIFHQIFEFLWCHLASHQEEAKNLLIGFWEAS
jgi:hypothetical protein